MTLHLAEISRAVAPGAHAVVIVDGAGWPKPGGLLKLPDTNGFPVLPPCCPELNPQENIRQDLRQNDLSNRVFDTCDARNALVAQPQHLHLHRNPHLAQTGQCLVPLV